MRKKSSGFTLKRIWIYLQRNRRQMFSFLICVGLSALLWFTIKLNRQYVQEVAYHIHFTGYPENEELQPLQPPVINLEIKTHGYEILRNRLFSNHELSIDLNHTLLREAMEPGVFYITAQALIARIASELPLTTVVLSVKPDTLYFHLDVLGIRKIKILPDITFDLRQGYYLHDTFHVVPDSVTITGKIDIVDKIPFVKTHRLNIQSDEGSFSHKIRLLNPFPGKVKINTDDVVISGMISRFVEKTFSATVIAGDSVMQIGVLKVQNVEVRCSIPTEEIPAFNPLGFEVVANQVVREGNTLYAILEPRCPPFVKKIRIVPDKIAIEPLPD
jgi:hypothetical protein